MKTQTKWLDAELKLIETLNTAIGQQMRIDNECRNSLSDRTLDLIELRGELFYNQFKNWFLSVNQKVYLTENNRLSEHGKMAVNGTYPNSNKELKVANQKNGGGVHTA